VWPALGLGTWRLGEDRARRRAEIDALRLAFEIGYRLVDTAEMYGEGGAEEVVGEAVAGALAAGLPRESLVVVSKVYPHHASRAGMLAACERSLRRLRLDRIDLYLLHWRGGVPLADTLAGFAELRARGWVRHWGVSNFDVADLEELAALAGGDECAANQVYYSLGQRGIEFDLLPWMRRRAMPLMAYCPIDQGALAGARAPQALRQVAERHGATPAQVALAAVLETPGVIAIPKSVRAAHLRENWAAASIALDAEDRAALDAAFPPPRRKRPLAMT
jgi:diketogulonate reductase-like aldo/keto reductase